MKYTIYSGFSELIMSNGIEFAADYAKTHGFSSVEFLVMENSPIMDISEAKKFKEVLDSRGLAVACYSLGINLYNSPETEELLKKHTEYASVLGSPFLHHTLKLSYTPSPETFETVMNDVLPRALRVAEYAKKLGVICLYEEQGLYFNGIENFRVFYNRMKSLTDNVGVCGDMGNIMFVCERPQDFFKAFASEILHVHVKDYLMSSEPLNEKSARKTDGNYLTNTLFGKGNAEIDKCIEILIKNGYKGCYAFETDMIASSEFDEVSKKNIEYMNSILNSYS